MSQQTKSTEFTNWLSFLHDEYISAMQMGKYNFDSIQLAGQWWSLYLERKYVQDQRHIIYFMVAMFRLTNKHVLRGGIGHMATKGNEDSLALMQTATKIESISFKGITQPNITFIPPKNVRADSWENQFERLAVEMMLKPQNYIEGFEVNSEKSYSSPLALTALKIYLRTLELAISYEIKRKVINQMSKTQDTIMDYIKEFDERVDESFLSAAKKVNDVEKKLAEMEKHVDSFIESTKGKINLVLKKQLAELEPRVEKLVDLNTAIDRLEKELGEKKLFKGFLGRKALKKMLNITEG